MVVTMPLIDLLTHAGWNVLLAIIPIVLAYLIAGLVRRPKKQGRSFVTVLIALLVFAWLSFLPNTCYLLTRAGGIFYPRIISITLP